MSKEKVMQDFQRTLTTQLSLAQQFGAEELETRLNATMECCRVMLEHLKNQAREAEQVGMFK